MATVVYALCALTSLACAVLLTRGYVRARTRLLFWSAWCFWVLFVNNVLLVVDLAIWTDQDLRLVRTATGLAGLLLLLYGLVFDVEEGTDR